ncbi:MAG: cell division protein FtsH, partial [Rhodobacteraceae bacterium]|nr:cell division protein FtsH [Paracoccaceae bacterium]
MESRHKFNLGYLAFVILCVLIFQGWIAYRTVATLQYSAFLDYLKDRRIAEVTVTESRIEGRFTTPVEGKEYFVTQRVEPGFAAELEAAGVKFAGGSDQTWLTTLLSWILPVLFFFGLWAIFFRRMAERQGMGGLINIGKSRARVYVERDTGVTFEDVAGVDE